MNNKLSPNENMKSVIQRIATGPELSKNISREEAKQTPWMKIWGFMMQLLKQRIL